MEVIVNEVQERWKNNNLVEDLIEVHRITGDSWDKIFRRMYALQRSVRYCSGRFYRFKDQSLKPEYQEWIKKNETIELYYGGGVVD